MCGTPNPSQSISARAVRFLSINNLPLFSNSTGLIAPLLSLGTKPTNGALRESMRFGLACRYCPVSELVHRNKVLDPTDSITGYNMRRFQRLPNCSDSALNTASRRCPRAAQRQCLSSRLSLQFYDRDVTMLSNICNHSR
jgi:hypothetical protein